MVCYDSSSSDVSLSKRPAIPQADADKPNLRENVLEREGEACVVHEETRLRCAVGPHEKNYMCGCISRAVCPNEENRKDYDSLLPTARRTSSWTTSDKIIFVTMAREDVQTSRKEGAGNEEAAQQEKARNLKVFRTDPALGRQRNISRSSDIFFLFFRQNYVKNSAKNN